MSAMRAIRMTRLFLSIADSRCDILRFTALPASIQRIAPFPPLALQLLNCVPTIVSDEDKLRALLEPEARLIAAVRRVVSGGDDAPSLDASLDTMLEQLGPAKFAEIAFTILVRDYMRGTFELSAGLQY